MAGFAFVEPLAGVHRHRLRLDVPACRACDGRFHLDGGHFPCPTGGTAQTSPGLHARVGRKMCRPAKNIATTAAPMKNGRYGSSSVRLPIQAPVIPNVTSISGPRQQVEARIAASPPASRAPRTVFG